MPIGYLKLSQLAGCMAEWNLELTRLRKTPHDTPMFMSRRDPLYLYKMNHQLWKKGARPNSPEKTLWMFGLTWGCPKNTHK